MATLNRTLFQELAGQHLDDARLLLQEKRWAGAYYLAGYAVECALKACIAKLTREHDFPGKDFAQRAHTHRIGSLVDLAGLEEARKARCRESEVFDTNWRLVTNWSEVSR